MGAGRVNSFLRNGRGWESRLRFYWNKLRYGFLDPSGGHTVVLGEPMRGAAMPLEIRVDADGANGRLAYVIMRDELGLKQVFQPPWFYVENHCEPQADTIQIFRRILARLPARASLNFVLSTEITQAAAVVEAFRRAGIRTVLVDTFFYHGPAGTTDVIESLSGKSIKGTLRRARRDLDVMAMTPADFVSFHARNIEAMGKKSYRDFDADLAMLEHGIPEGYARIFAARRKLGPGETAPFDAAIACAINPERDIYKLWRLTRRPPGTGDGSPDPHPDAAKLLVLEAMEDAVRMGLSFDTDGTTPGMSKLFAMFGDGVFKPMVRIQCMRPTMGALFHKEYPRMARWLRRLVKGRVEA
jgi:hypothetical protein